MLDIDAVRNNTPVWLDIFFNMYRSNDSDVYSTSLPLKLLFQFYFFLCCKKKEDCFMLIIILSLAYNYSKVF